MQVGLFGIELTCRCVRCGAPRDWPDNDRKRWVAHGPDPAEGITLTADDRCRCGAQRVRIRLEFDEDGSEEGEEDAL